VSHSATTPAAPQLAPSEFGSQTLLVQCNPIDITGRGNDTLRPHDSQRLQSRLLPCATLPLRTKVIRDSSVNSGRNFRRRPLLRLQQRSIPQRMEVHLPAVVPHINTVAAPVFNEPGMV
jgi:hypothetical protein